MAPARYTGWEFVRVLADLAEEGFSGRIDVSVGQAGTEIFFSRGGVLLARAADVRLSFPAFLLRKQILDREVLQSSLGTAKSEQQALERVLLGAGVFSEEVLAEHKAALSRDILERLFVAPQLDIELQPADPAPPGLKQPPVLYIEAFFRAVQRRANPADLSAYLAGRMDCRIHLTDPDNGLLDLFGKVFGREKMPGYLEGGTTVAALLEGAEAERQLREIFALTWMRIAWFHHADATTDAGASQQIWSGVLSEYGKG